MSREKKGKRLAQKMSILLKKESKKWLDTAKEAALLGGDLLLKSGYSARKIKIDSGRDIKIKGDIQSERIIVDYLKKHSDFSILSEESGLLSGKNQDFTWIVDPLDGSLNYLRLIPFSCVSVGLWQGQNPVLGAVYDFNHMELYSGVVGQTAWLNSDKLKIRDTRQKIKAVLCTGFPSHTDFAEGKISDFIDSVRSYKKIRLLGSAALSIVYVASGKVDAYYERNIMLWDVAGSIPILLGAGGKIKMKKVPGRYLYDVFAWNGYLKEGLI